MVKLIMVELYEAIIIVFLFFETMNESDLSWSLCSDIAHPTARMFHFDS